MTLYFLLTVQKTLYRAFRLPLHCAAAPPARRAASRRVESCVMPVQSVISLILKEKNHDTLRFGSVMVFSSVMA